MLSTQHDQTKSPTSQTVKVAKNQLITNYQVPNADRCTLTATKTTIFRLKIRWCKKVSGSTRE